MSEWSLQDAKNRFSAVVTAAMAGTPQRVTRRGRDAVVIVGAAEFDRLKRHERAHAPSFTDMLLAIPRDDGKFERIELAPRDIDL